jgi:hypothetical protein
MPQCELFPSHSNTILAFGQKMSCMVCAGCNTARDRFLLDRDRYHNALLDATTYVKADQAVPFEIRELLCGAIVSSCFDIVAATSGIRGDDES